MDDHILRVTAANGMIRAFFADTKNTVNTAADIHQTTPVMSAALGRLLSACAIMGLMLKNEDDLITLSIKCAGDAGGFLATSDINGKVKGYAYNPQADAPLKPNGNTNPGDESACCSSSPQQRFANTNPGDESAYCSSSPQQRFAKLNVSGVIGDGSLTVIKDMGMKEPYVSSVELQTGEIAEDIAYYFVQSEQTPAVVSLGVLVDTDHTIKQSGGFIIQLMPGASDEIIDFLEKKITALDSLTSLYERGFTPESIADTLFSEIGYTVGERIPVTYFCNCSYDRVKKVLLSIGKSDLEKMLKEDKSAQLNCHFCNKQYTFNENDLRDLILNGTP